MAEQYSDRFTDASREVSEKSGFVCENCNKTYPREEAVKQRMTCCNRTLKELVKESFGP